MESIEQGLEIWMPNAPNVSSGSCGSVQKVTFKTVQKLNCQTYTLTLGLICYLAVNIGPEFEFFFSRSGPGEYAQSLMKRPAQDIGTEDSGLADDRLQPFCRRLSDFWIRADGAGIRSCDRDGGTLELQFV